MPKKAASPKPPSSYELLGARIQKIINSPAAQKARAATIYKSLDESDDDWAQLTAEIAENDGVTVVNRDDGGLHIFWIVPKED